MYVYVAGFAGPSGSQSMLQTDGTWALLNAGSSTTPVKIMSKIAISVAPNNSTTVTLPSYVSSARLYIVEGAPMEWEMVSAGSGRTTVVQPLPTTPGTVAHDNRWGFIEFTSNADEFFVNLSNVDFVSLPIGIAGTDTAGAVHTVPGLMQTIPGSTAPYSKQVTAANVTQQMCLDLAVQAQLDGNAWGDLCVYSRGNLTSTKNYPLRILAPSSQVNIPAPNYYDSYIAEVWDFHSKVPLSINTQTNAAVVKCMVTASGTLGCQNSTVAMPRPTSADVWGCSSGAFAITGASDAVHKAVVPRVCAAFTRSTLLANGGNMQPGPAVTEFYNRNITNHYARILHEREVIGGYAFSYDDVGVDGVDAGNQMGAIQVGSMQTLDVYVGG